MAGPSHWATVGGRLCLFSTTAGAHLADALLRVATRGHGVQCGPPNLPPSTIE